VLHHALDGEPGLDVYRPFTQASTAGPYYVLRTSGDPMRLARPATAIIGRTDPNQSFLDVQTYEGRLANQLWQRRLSGRLFAAFALLAVLLAAVGLYGVISQLVAQQTRELGVRMALGAGHRDIMRLVLGRGLRLAATGALAGLLLALALGRAIAGLLYGVHPVDLLTFAVMTGATLAVAALATGVPARRAARVDPLTALKAE
jgi:putative ABC transport system permease protein